MDSFGQDLRQAIRSLLGTPGFTIAALLTLAIGIGANSAIFSVVDGVLLRPTPVADIDRVMMVWQTDRNAGTTREPASVPDFQDIRQRSSQFTAIELVTPVEVNVTPDNADPRRSAAVAATTGLLPMFGIEPILGRLFSDQEGTQGHQQVILISEGMWESMYSRDSSVIGRELRLNDVPYRIIGVLPRNADFGMLQILGAAAYGRAFAQRGERVDIDIWAPAVLSPQVSRDNHTVFLMGRLAAEATVATAQQELTGIAEDLERNFPSNAARGLFVEPFRDVVFSGTTTALYLLMGAVALVLLVACTNVANLLLARNSARLREVTVRIALGAARRRIVQQFLVESFVLTSVGALLGLVVADASLSLLQSIAPASVPRMQLAGVDARVLGATAIVTMLVAIVFGLIPALQTRTLHLQDALQGTSAKGVAGGHAQRRWRNVLVAGQLAAAVMLMVCAGLLVRSLWQLQQVDPGFAVDGVLKAEYQLPASRYPRPMQTFPNFPAQNRFNAELQSRIERVPGVVSASLAVYHPLDRGSTSSIRVVGREAEGANWPEPAIRMIGVGYFETMRVPVQLGRGFGVIDEPASTPVIVINEAARARYFADQDPIGQQIFLWGANRSVIGVVGNERFQGLGTSTPPGVYVPLTQVPSRFGAHTLLVRTSQDPLVLVASLRSIVQELDPALPLFGVEPLSETVAGSLSQQRFAMLVLGGFALVALALAIIGVHGVLNYAVSLRTREIGIRVALGAAPAQVQWAVVGEGAKLAAVGLTIGLVSALALTRLLSSLLYGVSAHDPLTFVGVAVILGATALIACYIPARRAARVDPIVALRTE